MSFKVFEKGSAPVATVPAVTIQKRGLVSLNDAAYRMLEEPDAITFLWDEDERLIGMRKASENDLNGYPTRRQASKKGNGPVLIAGSTFMKYVGVSTECARRWTPQMQDDMLVIDLKVEGALVISNRNRKKFESPSD